MHSSSSAPGRIAVTGASGRLGSAVARLLAESGTEQILIGRRPERLPDLPGAERRGPAEYRDTAAMTDALAGTGALLLISAGLSGDRFREHMSVVSAAQRAGAHRIVYISLLGASPIGTFAHSRDHWQTEFALARADIESAIVRPGYYSAMLGAQADEDHVIHALDAEARISAVAHADIAAVAVALLTESAPTGAALSYGAAVHTVTGPEALSWREIAGALTDATGIPYRVREETLAESIRRRAATEHDPGQIERWVSWHASIARGEAAEVTDTVPRILGRPAIPLREVLRQAAAPA